jgi:isopenicillin N synthase-like dioxygenase
MLLMHYCRKNDTSADNISTKDGRGQHDDQEFLSFVSQSTNLPLYNPITPPHWTPHWNLHWSSTPSPHNLFINANRLLDLSTILFSMHKETTTLDTTYSINSHGQPLRKEEQQSSSIEIWSQGPA